MQLLLHPAHILTTPLFHPLPHPPLHRYSRLTPHHHSLQRPQTIRLPLRLVGIQKILGVPQTLVMMDLQLSNRFFHPSRRARRPLHRTNDNIREGAQYRPITGRRLPFTVKANEKGNLWSA